jgi:uncharacterized protein YwgA
MKTLHAVYKAWDAAMNVLQYLIARIFHTHMESNLTLRDYVLAIIKLGSSRDGEFRYKTRIHKILFILAHEFEELNNLRSDFIPYHFGPWSYEVDFTIKELVRSGFLEEKLDKRDEIDGLQHTGYVYAYRLTRAGKVLAERAIKKLSPKIRERIKELLKLKLWTLIGYVYVKYPEYTTRSVLTDDELTPSRQEISSTT